MQIPREQHNLPFRKQSSRLRTFYYALLFSALGCFSCFLLLDYTNLADRLNVSMALSLAVVITVCVFNVFGFSLIKINDWLARNSPLFFTKRSRLMWHYTMIAILLLLLNYTVFFMVKWAMGIPEPYMIVSRGVRLIVTLWFVEMTIVGLLLVNNSMQYTLAIYKEKEQLVRETTRAQYVALQNQLNPHFLFNSLNTLIAEIEYDPANASLFTRNLSDVYRYILQRQDQLVVSLGEELDFLDSYIFLHRVRLGECLHVEKCIPSELLECKVPPLTLQLLAENVIKHNYIAAATPITIRLEVDQSAQILTFSNELRPKQNTCDSGTGLRNLAERYRLLCNKTIEINRSDNLFQVSVPLIYE